jgi:PTS system galactitol-specific IIC component
MAIQAGVTIPKGASLIGNLDRANLISWLIIKIFSIF